MTASNHVVAGALIASAVPQAAVAIPLAFVSHFIMDALPHFGDTDNHSWLNRHFNYVLGIDILLTVLFILGIVVFQPASWMLMVICGLVAISPDLLWIPYFLAHLKHEHKEHSKLAKFLKWIQWGERPWGIYIEGVVLILGILLFIKIA